MECFPWEELSIKVARYILFRFAETNFEITNLKLNKLLYIIHLAYYSRFKKSLFEEAFIAWPYGPILRSVYFKFCAWRNNPMDLRYETGECYTKPLLDIALQSVIEDVLSFYGNFCHCDMMKFTNHCQSDWKKTIEKSGVDTPLPRTPGEESIKFLFKTEVPKIYTFERRLI